MDVLYDTLQAYRCKLIFIHFQWRFNGILDDPLNFELFVVRKPWCLKFSTCKIISDLFFRCVRLEPNGIRSDVSTGPLDFQMFVIRIC